MTDYPDWNEPAANAVALSTTNLVGTGLARESGGNLDTHTKLLSGTQAGALITNIGNTNAQETAAWIASGTSTGTPGGTPLLHGAKQVYSSTGNVIPVSGTFNTGAIPISKPGYLIRVNAQMSGVNAVVPFLEADLTWSVTPNTGQVTAEEIWYLNCGSSGSVNTRGKGPTKGNQLNITFTNGDATDTCTVSVQVWETTQHISRDDWRNPGGVPSASATGIHADSLANIIANDTFTVGAGATVLKNMPLYAGDVNVWLDSVTGPTAQVNIVPVGDFNVATPQPLATFDWTVNFRTPTRVTLPRCPCQLQFVNGGTGSVTAQVSLVALEYAS